LGAQATVAAGGRYDGLVEQLGGRPTPAIGFALGVERIIALLEAMQQPVAAATDAPHAYMVLVGEAASEKGMVLAEQLRHRLPELRLQVNCGGGSFKAQFRPADRSGARVALVLGEDELASGTIGLKWLREDREQERVQQQALADRLRGITGE
jgi:histidyl-tRNA synthetase